MELPLNFTVYIPSHDETTNFNYAMRAYGGNCVGGPDV